MIWEDGIPYNTEPARLLRLQVSATCNFSCTFCCWKNAAAPPFAARPLLPRYYGLLLEALVRTGHDSAHLTGGEPLALDLDFLCAIVAQAARVPRLASFWITTNGSLLDVERCARLRAAGLCGLSVSIGAETNAKYRRYARAGDPAVDLDSVLSRIRLAVGHGFEVTVDVPVSADGIHTFDQLMVLVRRLEAIGVRRVGYFKLHLTAENRRAFARLYRPEMVPGITRGLLTHPDWTLGEEEGMGFFRHQPSGIVCWVPRAFARRNPHCARSPRGCGDYCQGAYAVYFLYRDGRILLRACHRQFKDRRNEFEIEPALFERQDVGGLATALNSAWQWVSTR